MHYQPKKAALTFNFVTTQGLSGSQDQKERKTASTVTTTFFGQKIITAQIRFRNDSLLSVTAERNNNEHIKIV